MEDEPLEKLLNAAGEIPGDVSKNSQGRFLIEAVEVILEEITEKFSKIRFIVFFFIVPVGTRYQSNALILRI